MCTFARMLGLCWAGCGDESRFASVRWAAAVAAVMAASVPLLAGCGPDGDAPLPIGTDRSTLRGAPSSLAESTAAAAASPVAASTAADAATPATARTPTAESTALPSPADVILTPERPALVDEHSTDGARASAQYYLQLFPYMIATGDTSEWDSRSSWSCGFCSSALEIARDMHAAGRHGEGGGFRITEVGTLRTPASPDRFEIVVSFWQAASTTVDAERTVVERFDGPSALRANVTVSWSGEMWIVDELHVS